MRLRPAQKDAEARRERPTLSPCLRASLREAKSVRLSLPRHPLQPRRHARPVARDVLPRGGEVAVGAPLRDLETVVGAGKDHDLEPRGVAGEGGAEALE